MNKNPAPFLRFSSLSLLLALCLASCQDPNEKVPPTVSILQPASDATITGTVPIQVDALDASGISSVKVYAHAKGSSVRGVLIGSAIKNPYAISWATGGPSGVPNNADLELVAYATDKNGNEGASSPVRVKTQNPGAPALNLLACFTYPPQVQTASTKPDPRASSNAVPSFSSLTFSRVTPPLNARATPASNSNLESRQAAGFKFAQQWEWLPVTGANGYGIYSSSTDLAGPYDNVRNQAASTGSASIEKFSRFVDTASAGVSLYGSITTLTNNAVTESGKSNADGCKFLPKQDSATPATGDNVPGGRPTLTWTSNPGVTGLNGYQYYIYDGNPFDNANPPKLKWSNYPATSDKLSAVYPIKDNLNNPFPALTTGTYYWMVAVVSFDAQSKADGFSYSEPKSFLVP